MYTNRNGYWSGMPSALKGQFYAWLVYYAIAGVIFTQSPILGIVLLVLPALWYFAKNMFLSYIISKTDLERKDTIFGYTLSYLWHSSVYVRGVMIAITLFLVLFSLGWISTEDLRLEAAKPTLTERITGTASAAAEATKDKTGGWVESAKGWFKRDDAEPE